MPLSVDKLINRLEYDLGWPDDVPHRAKALDFLNDADRYIAKQASCLYLNVTRPIVLASTASTIAAPTNPGWDYSKAATLEDDIGVLRFLPRDRFKSGAVATAYSIRNTRPAVWTIGFDITQALFLFFDPANTTGAGITYNFSHQRVVTDLADNAGSFSLLPDGDEVTLLLGRAVAEARRILGRAGWQQKQEEVSAQLAVFYDGQRMTKEQPQTDMETQQRKQFDVATSPDA